MPLLHRRKYLVAMAGSLGLAISMAAAPANAHDSDSPAPRRVASGLDSPRHLTFSPDGDLYVVEAGRGGTGPCTTHPELGEFCFGFSGGVTKVSDKGRDRRVVNGLPSIAGEGGDTLGPSDMVFTSEKRFVMSIGLGGNEELRQAFGPDGALLGTLVKGKLKSDTVKLVADVLANEAANNPDGTDIDSNPVGLLRRGDNFVVADAGGNAVVKVDDDEEFSTVAVLPPGSALAPPFLGLPPGTQIPTDSVPTSVVRGPDGAYYISQLTGFPFEKGDANIWRVRPGQAPTIYASGLTNVTDLAFGKDGKLYAVQISDDGLLAGIDGSLVRIRPHKSTHKTIADHLNAPYGVALTRSTAYVSTCSVCAGGGEVWRIPLDD